MGSVKGSTVSDMNVAQGLVGTGRQWLLLREINVEQMNFMYVWPSLSCAMNKGRCTKCLYLESKYCQYRHSDGKSVRNIHVAVNLSCAKMYRSSSTSARAID